MARQAKLWEKHTIPVSHTVRQCFEKINDLPLKFLVVLNKHGGVENTVTDGDLRRYVINNGSLDNQLDDLCTNKPPSTTASESESRQQLKRQLSEKIEFIPIIGANGQLVDIFHPTMAEFQIGHLSVSSDSPALVIAEIGNNHNGSLKNAFQLIDLAASAGADIVKFQMRQLDEIYASADSSSDDLGSQYTRDLLRKVQLSNDEFREVFNYCNKKNITVLCTPFDSSSVDILEDLNIPAYKVASADFMNWPLLEYIAGTGKPILLSTGMTTENDLRDTSDFLNRINANYLLMHCNSSYPAPFKDVNLAYLDRLKRYSLYPFVGYSGHERGFHIPLAAVAIGAKVIEKHFTVDRNLEGNDHKVSLLPDEFEKMTLHIRDIEVASGSSVDRTLSQGEMLNRDILGKSLTAIADIEIGDSFTLQNIGVKGPGGGVSPHKLDALLQHRAQRRIKTGEQLFSGDLARSDTSFIESYFNRPVGIPVRYHDFENLTNGRKLDFVEFHLSYADLSLDPSDYFDDNQTLEFLVHAPELFEADHILDLSSLDSDYRKLSKENLKRTLQCTTNLTKFFPKTTKPLVITNAGGWSLDGFLSEAEKKEKYLLVAEALDELSAPTHEIIIQTMPPYPWHFGGQRHHNLFVDPNEIRQFCDEYGYRICLDISHISCCEFPRARMGFGGRHSRPHHCTSACRRWKRCRL